MDELWTCQVFFQKNKTTKYVFMTFHVSNICLGIIDSMSLYLNPLAFCMYSGLCNVVCLCLVVHENSYAGLYNAQSRLNVTLTVTPSVFFPKKTGTPSVIE